jgi:hypothetical protein
MGTAVFGQGDLHAGASCLVGLEKYEPVPVRNDHGVLKDF